MLIPDSITSQSTLQDYLDATGLPLEEVVPPRIYDLIGTIGANNAPWSVILIGDREPTENERIKGLLLEEAAKSFKYPSPI